MSNPWVRLLNNWTHDVASGVWAACVLLLAILAGKQGEMTGAAVEAWQVVAELSLLLFRMAAVSLVVIGATGGVRLMYWRQTTHPKDMRQKRPALIGKHALFFLVYGAGTIWAYNAVWPMVK